MIRTDTGMIPPGEPRVNIDEAELLSKRLLQKKVENVGRITELLKQALRERDEWAQIPQEQLRRVQTFLLKELCRDGWTEETKRGLMKVTMNDLANLDTITQALLQTIRNELGRVSEEIGEELLR